MNSRATGVCSEITPPIVGGKRAGLKGIFRKTIGTSLQGE
jgi:hypothetical protein